MGLKFVNRIMAAILFLAETIFFIFEKVENPTSDSYSETPIAYIKK